MSADRVRAGGVAKGRRGAFTLIELLVVIAVIVLLVAILVPSLAKAKEAAKRTRCLSNVKQIGVAISCYVAEFSYLLPLNPQPKYLPSIVYPPLHYPSNQSGLLALEQNETFKRKYLACPEGWASTNRGNNWYINGDLGDEGSANMDYIYWGARFGPPKAGSYSVEYASFQYKYRDPGMKILVTDTIEDVTGELDKPLTSANRNHGNHLRIPPIVLSCTDGKGNPTGKSVTVVAKGGSVLFSDFHTEWVWPRKYTQVESNLCYPPPDQW